MTAEIVILADYRARRATLRLTFDPFAFWRAWAAFWMGGRTADTGSGVVRAISGAR